MINFRIFLDFSKEEKYLKEMAKKGYELKDYIGGIYNFKKIKPEDTTYRIDYRSFVNKQDYIDYYTMFEDSGWKKIAGSHFSGIQYFKKISGNSDDDIFSDEASKSARYKKLSEIWTSIGLLNLVLLFTFKNPDSMNLIQLLALGFTGISFITSIYFTLKLSKLYKETIAE